MPASAQLADQVDAEALLEDQRSRIEFMIVKGADEMLRFEPRRFDCLLWIHAELDHIEQNLNQCLVLIVPPGRRERRERLTILHDQGR